MGILKHRFKAYPIWSNRLFGLSIRLGRLSRGGAYSYENFRKELDQILLLCHHGLINTSESHGFL